MQKLVLEQHIEAKIKQAEENIKNSYRQYIDDIEGLKALMPEDQRHIIDELAAEADRRQERLLTIAGIYLRPYITAHIRTILALESANDTLPAADRAGSSDQIA